MKCFLDTEFIEDGRTIELLSIGIVREDGAEYYAEVAHANIRQADEWVLANVIPHLKGGDALKRHMDIGAEIVAFVGDSPEFWAYYADYDWVALCQLYGRMIDLPKGWPMYCRDLKQAWDAGGFAGKPTDAVTQTGIEHHALADAHWNRALHQHIFGTPAKTLPAHYREVGDKALARVVELEAELAEAVALLRAAEWQIDDDGFSFCGTCAGYRDDGHPARTDHEPGCPLTAFLARHLVKA